MGARAAELSHRIIHSFHCAAAGNARRISARAGERGWARHLEPICEFEKGPEIFRAQGARYEQARPRPAASFVDHRPLPPLPKSMIRSALLYLSGQSQVFRFVRNNRFAKSFANRFVAGETLDTALEAVSRLNARGI